MNLADLAAAIFGAVFVYAGVSKLLMGGEWPKSADALGIARPLAYLVLPAEIAVGLGAVVGGAWQRSFLAAGAVMLVAFTALLLKHLRSGHRPPCACFGTASRRPIGGRDIVRNVSLLVLVVVAFAS